MVRRRLIRTILCVLVVVTCLTTLSGLAEAKGAQDATISGPRIAGTLVVGTGWRPSPVNVNELAVASGTFFVMAKPASSAVQDRRPRGPLGPRYRIVFRMYTGADELTPIRQDVYPFARAGVVSYTPPGQRAFGRAVATGWYTSAIQTDPNEGGVPSTVARALFVSAGIPDRPPSS